jgi:hypothetical protein
METHCVFCEVETEFLYSLLPEWTLCFKVAHIYWCNNKSCFCYFKSAKFSHHTDWHILRSKANFHLQNFSLTQKQGNTVYINPIVIKLLIRGYNRKTGSSNRKFACIPFSAEDCSLVCFQYRLRTWYMIWKSRNSVRSLVCRAHVCTGYTTDIHILYTALVTCSLLGRLSGVAVRQ